MSRLRAAAAHRGAAARRGRRDPRTTAWRPRCDRGQQVARSALNWLRTGAGAALLADIAAGRLALTHEALDAHPRSHAADYLRHVLVANGALPDRDEEVARTERWAIDLVASLARPEDRRLAKAYTTWRVLRGSAEAPHTALGHAPIPTPHT